MPNLSDISVVLPSLDPDTKLIGVIDGLIEYGFTDIILINDGSKPENLYYFEEAARHPEVHLLHHEVNRGKGAALKTAFSWFLQNRPDALGVVTADGDGQHHPADIKACALHMMNADRLVLGVRDFDQPDVPFKSRNGNKITSFVFKAFVGMSISDTQTGLRAIPRKDLPTLSAIAGDRFEYETNMLLATKEHGIAFDEVTIQTVYIEENQSSHFRAVRDSWRIYKLIFAHFFRYAASSLLSACVDWTLYVLLCAVLHTDFFDGIALTSLCALCARAVSSLLNFYMNQKFVFHSGENVWKAMLKYYALALPQLLVQILLTEGVYMLLGIEYAPLLRGLVYGLVMVVLFIASFLIQQRWVFAKKKEN